MLDFFLSVQTGSNNSFFTFVYAFLRNMNFELHLSVDEKETAVPGYILNGLAYFFLSEVSIYIAFGSL